MGAITALMEQVTIHPVAPITVPSLFSTSVYNKTQSSLGLTSSCDVIADTGRCISHFTNVGIDWHGARDQCLSRGGDLATVTSLEEYNLMYSLNTAFANCWIGLNDLETEGTWVWADGDNSTFRYWAPGEPNNDFGVQDCGCTWTHHMMDDCNCEWIFTCYFCSRVGELLRMLIVHNSFYILSVHNKLVNLIEFLDIIIFE